MKNLFDKEIYEEVNRRINTLSPASQRLWGKMDVAQMLAHCKEAFSVPLSEKKMPQSLLGLLLGWAMRPMLYNDKPWKQGLPTAKRFKITGERDFEKEKQQLMSLINTFYSRGPAGVGNFPHPLFGRFTKPQWGQAMYKHLDHHLNQFGV